MGSEKSIAGNLWEGLASFGQGLENFVSHPDQALDKLAKAEAPSVNWNTLAAAYKKLEDAQQATGNKGSLPSDEQVLSASGYLNTQTAEGKAVAEQILQREKILLTAFNITKQGKEIHPKAGSNPLYLRALENIYDKAGVSILSPAEQIAHLQSSLGLSEKQAKEVVANWMNRHPNFESRKSLYYQILAEQHQDNPLLAISLYRVAVAYDPRNEERHYEAAKGYFAIAKEHPGQSFGDEKPFDLAQVHLGQLFKSRDVSYASKALLLVRESDRTQPNDKEAAKRTSGFLKVAHDQLDRGNKRLKELGNSNSEQSKAEVIVLTETLLDLADEVKTVSATTPEDQASFHLIQGDLRELYKRAVEMRNREPGQPGQAAVFQFNKEEQNNAHQAYEARTAELAGKQVESEKGFDAGVKAIQAKLEESLNFPEKGEPSDDQMKAAGELLRLDRELTEKDYSAWTQHANRFAALVDRLQDPEKRSANTALLLRDLVAIRDQQRASGNIGEVNALLKHWSEDLVGHLPPALTTKPGAKEATTHLVDLLVKENDQRVLAHLNPKDLEEYLEKVEVSEKLFADAKAIDTKTPAHDPEKTEKKKKLLVASLATLPALGDKKSVQERLTEVDQLVAQSDEVEKLKIYAAVVPTLKEVDKDVASPFRKKVEELAKKHDKSSAFVDSDHQLPYYRETMAVRAVYLALDDLAGVQRTKENLDSTGKVLELRLQKGEVTRLDERLESATALLEIDHLYFDMAASTTSRVGKYFSDSFSDKAVKESFDRSIKVHLPIWQKAMADAKAFEDKHTTVDPQTGLKKLDERAVLAHASQIREAKAVLEILHHYEPFTRFSKSEPVSTVLSAVNPAASARQAVSQLKTLATEAASHIPDPAIRSATIEAIERLEQAQESVITAVAEAHPFEKAKSLALEAASHIPDAKIRQKTIDAIETLYQTEMSALSRAKSVVSGSAGSSPIDAQEFKSFLNPVQQMLRQELEIDLEKRVGDGLSHFMEEQKLNDPKSEEAGEIKLEVIQAVVADLKSVLKEQLENGSADELPQTQFNELVEKAAVGETQLSIARLEEKQLAQETTKPKSAKQAKAIEAKKAEKRQEINKRYMMAAATFARSGLKERAAVAMQPLAQQAETHPPLERLVMLNKMVEIYQTSGMTDEANQMLQKVVDLDTPPSKDPEIHEAAEIARASQACNKGDFYAAHEILVKVPNSEAAQQFAEAIQKTGRTQRVLETVKVLQTISLQYIAAGKEHAKSAGVNIDAVERDTVAGWQEVNRLLLTGEVHTLDEALKRIQSEGRFKDFTTGLGSDDENGKFKASFGYEGGMTVVDGEIRNFAHEVNDFSGNEKVFVDRVLNFADRLIGESQAGIAMEVYSAFNDHPLVGKEAHTRMTDRLREHARFEAAVEIAKNWTLVGSVASMFLSGANTEEIKNSPFELLSFGVGGKLRILAGGMHLVKAARAARTAQFLGSTLGRHATNWAIQKTTEAAAITLTNMSIESATRGSLENWTVGNFLKGTGNMFVMFGTMHVGGMAMQRLGKEASRIRQFRNSKAAAHEVGVHVLSDRAQKIFGKLNYATTLTTMTLSDYESEFFGLKDKDPTAEWMGFTDRLLHSAVTDKKMGNSMKLLHKIDKKSAARDARLARVSQRLDIREARAQTRARVGKAFETVQATRPELMNEMRAAAHARAEAEVKGRGEDPTQNPHEVQKRADKIVKDEVERVVDTIATVEAQQGRAVDLKPEDLARRMEELGEVARKRNPDPTKPADPAVVRELFVYSYVRGNGVNRPLTATELGGALDRIQTAGENYLDRTGIGQLLRGTPDFADQVQGMVRFAIQNALPVEHLEQMAQAAQGSEAELNRTTQQIFGDANSPAAQMFRADVALGALYTTTNPTDLRQNFERLAENAPRIVEDLNQIVQNIYSNPQGTAAGRPELAYQLVSVAMNGATVPSRGIDVSRFVQAVHQLAERATSELVQAVDALLNTQPVQVDGVLRSATALNFGEGHLPLILLAVVRGWTPEAVYELQKRIADGSMTLVMENEQISIRESGKAQGDAQGFSGGSQQQESREQESEQQENLKATHGTEQMAEFVNSVNKSSARSSIVTAWQSIVQDLAELIGKNPYPEIAQERRGRLEALAAQDRANGKESIGIAPMMSILGPLGRILGLFKSSSTVQASENKALTGESESVASTQVQQWLLSDAEYFDTPHLLTSQIPGLTSELVEMFLRGTVVNRVPRGEMKGYEATVYMEVERPNGAETIFGNFGASKELYQIYQAWNKRLGFPKDQQEDGGKTFDNLVKYAAERGLKIEGHAQPAQAAYIHEILTRLPDSFISRSKNSGLQGIVLNGRRMSAAGGSEFANDQAIIFQGAFDGPRINLLGFLVHEMGHSRSDAPEVTQVVGPALNVINRHQSIFALDWKGAGGKDYRAGYTGRSLSEFIAEFHLIYFAKGDAIRSHINELRRMGQSEAAQAYQNVYDLYRDSIFDGIEYSNGEQIPATQVASPLHEMKTVIFDSIKYPNKEQTAAKPLQTTSTLHEMSTVVFSERLPVGKESSISRMTPVKLDSLRTLVKRGDLTIPEDADVSIRKTMIRATPEASTLRDFEIGDRLQTLSNKETELRALGMVKQSNGIWKLTLSNRKDNAVNVPSLGVTIWGNIENANLYIQDELTSTQTISASHRIQIYREGEGWFSSNNFQLVTSKDVVSIDGIQFVCELEGKKGGGTSGNNQGDFSGKGLLHKAQNVGELDTLPGTEPILGVPISVAPLFEPPISNRVGKKLNRALNRLFSQFQKLGFERCGEFPLYEKDKSGNEVNWKVWQRIAYGPERLKDSHNSYRGYLMVNPTDFPQVLEVLQRVAIQRSQNNKTTEFKWLLASGPTREHIYDDGLQIGKYLELEASDSRIVITADSSSEIKEILTALSIQPEWKTIELNRNDQFKLTLPRAPRRTGTHALIVEQGKRRVEWRSLNYNDKPGYSENEAQDPNWRDHKDGMATLRQKDDSGGNFAHRLASKLQHNPRLIGGLLLSVAAIPTVSELVSAIPEILSRHGGFNFSATLELASHFLVNWGKSVAEVTGGAGLVMGNHLSDANSTAKSNPPIQSPMVSAKVGEPLRDSTKNPVELFYSSSVKLGSDPVIPAISKSISISGNIEPEHTEFVRDGEGKVYLKNLSVITGTHVLVKGKWINIEDGGAITSVEGLRYPVEPNQLIALGDPTDSTTPIITIKSEDHKEGRIEFKKMTLHWVEGAIQGSKETVLDPTFDVASKELEPLESPWEGEVWDGPPITLQQKIAQKRLEQQQKITAEQEAARGRVQQLREQLAARKASPVSQNIAEAVRLKEVPPPLPEAIRHSSITANTPSNGAVSVAFEGPSSQSIQLASNRKSILPPIIASIGAGFVTLLVTRSGLSEELNKGVQKIAEASHRGAWAVVATAGVVLAGLAYHQFLRPGTVTDYVPVDFMPVNMHGNPVQPGESAVAQVFNFGRDKISYLSSLTTRLRKGSFKEPAAVSEFHFKIIQSLSDDSMQLIDGNGIITSEHGTYVERNGQWVRLQAGEKYALRPNEYFAIGFGPNPKDTLFFNYNPVTKQLEHSGNITEGIARANTPPPFRQNLRTSRTAMIEAAEGRWVIGKGEVLTVPLNDQATQNFSAEVKDRNIKVPLFADEAEDLADRHMEIVREKDPQTRKIKTRLINLHNDPVFVPHEKGVYERDGKKYTAIEKGKSFELATEATQVEVLQGSATQIQRRVVINFARVIDIEPTFGLRWGVVGNISYEALIVQRVRDQNNEERIYLSPPYASIGEKVELLQPNGRWKEISESLPYELDLGTKKIELRITHQNRETGEIKKSLAQVDLSHLRPLYEEENLPFEPPHGVLESIEPQGIPKSVPISMSLPSSDHPVEGVSFNREPKKPVEIKNELGQLLGYKSSDPTDPRDYDWQVTNNQDAPLLIQRRKRNGVVVPPGGVAAVQDGDILFRANKGWKFKDPHAVDNLGKHPETGVVQEEISLSGKIENYLDQPETPGPAIQSELILFAELHNPGETYVLVRQGKQGLQPNQINIPDRRLSRNPNVSLVRHSTGYEVTPHDVNGEGVVWIRNIEFQAAHPELTPEQISSREDLHTVQREDGTKEVSTGWIKLKPNEKTNLPYGAEFRVGGNSSDAALPLVVENNGGLHSKKLISEVSQKEARRIDSEGKVIQAAQNFSEPDLVNVRAAVQPHRGKDFQFDKPSGEGSVYILGRSKESDIQIKDGSGIQADRTVSRQHLELTVDHQNKTLKVKDIRDANSQALPARARDGQINDVSVILIGIGEEVTLQPGDTLAVGYSTFKVEVSPEGKIFLAKLDTQIPDLAATRVNDQQKTDHTTPPPGLSGVIVDNPFYIKGFNPKKIPVEWVGVEQIARPSDVANIASEDLPDNDLEPVENIFEAPLVSAGKILRQKGINSISSTANGSKWPHTDLIFRPMDLSANNIQILITKYGAEIEESGYGKIYRLSIDATNLSPAEIDAKYVEVVEALESQKPEIEIEEKTVQAVSPFHRAIEESLISPSVVESIMTPIPPAHTERMRAREEAVVVKQPSVIDLNQVRLGVEAVQLPDLPFTVALRGSSLKLFARSGYEIKVGDQRDSQMLVEMNTDFEVAGKLYKFTDTSKTHSHPLPTPTQLYSPQHLAARARFLGNNEGKPIDIYAQGTPYSTESGLRRYIPFISDQSIRLEVDFQGRMYLIRPIGVIQGGSYFRLLHPVGNGKWNTIGAVTSAPPTALISSEFNVGDCIMTGQKIEIDGVLHEPYYVVRIEEQRLLLDVQFNPLQKQSPSSSGSSGNGGSFASGKGESVTEVKTQSIAAEKAEARAVANDPIHVKLPSLREGEIKQISGAHPFAVRLVNNQLWIFPLDRSSQFQVTKETPFSLNGQTYRLSDLNPNEVRLPEARSSRRSGSSRAVASAASYAVTVGAAGGATAYTAKLGAPQAKTIQQAAHEDANKAQKVVTKESKAEVHQPTPIDVPLQGEGGILAPLTIAALAASRTGRSRSHLEKAKYKHQLNRAGKVGDSKQELGEEEKVKSNNPEDTSLSDSQTDREKTALQIISDFQKSDTRENPDRPVGGDHPSRYLELREGESVHDYSETNNGRYQSYRVMLDNGKRAYRVATGESVTVKVKEGESITLASKDFFSCAAMVAKGQNPQSGDQVLIFSHLEWDNSQGQYDRLVGDLSRLVESGVTDLQVYMNIDPAAAKLGPKREDSHASFYTFPDPKDETRLKENLKQEIFQKTGKNVDLRILKADLAILDVEGHPTSRNIYVTEEGVIVKNDIDDQPVQVINFVKPLSRKSLAVENEVSPEISQPTITLGDLVRQEKQRFQLSTEGNNSSPSEILKPTFRNKLSLHNRRAHNSDITGGLLLAGISLPAIFEVIQAAPEILARHGRLNLSSAFELAGRFFTAFRNYVAEATGGLSLVAGMNQSGGKAEVTGLTLDQLKSANRLITYSGIDTTIINIPTLDSKNPAIIQHIKNGSVRYTIGGSNTGKPAEQIVDIELPSYKGQPFEIVETLETPPRRFVHGLIPGVAVRAYHTDAATTVYRQSEMVTDAAGTVWIPVERKPLELKITSGSNQEIHLKIGLPVDISIEGISPVPEAPVIAPVSSSAPAVAGGLRTKTAETVGYKLTPDTKTPNRYYLNIDPNKKITLGRGEHQDPSQRGNDIIAPDQATLISRRHLEVYSWGGSFKITIDGLNGVIKDGVTYKPITQGDRQIAQELQVGVGAELKLPDGSVIVLGSPPDPVQIAAEQALATRIQSKGFTLNGDLNSGSATLIFGHAPEVVIGTHTTLEETGVRLNSQYRTIQPRHCIIRRRSSGFEIEAIGLVKDASGAEHHYSNSPKFYASPGSKIVLDGGFTINLEFLKGDIDLKPAVPTTSKPAPEASPAAAKPSSREIPIWSISNEPILPAGYFYSDHPVPLRVRWGAQGERSQDITDTAAISRDPNKPSYLVLKSGAIEISPSASEDRETTTLAAIHYRPSQGFEIAPPFRTSQLNRMNVRRDLIQSRVALSGSELENAMVAITDKGPFAFSITPFALAPKIPKLEITVGDKGRMVDTSQVATDRNSPSYAYIKNGVLIIEKTEGPRTQFKIHFDLRDGSLKIRKSDNNPDIFSKDGRRVGRDVEISLHEAARLELKSSDGVLTNFTLVQEANLTETSLAASSIDTGIQVSYRHVREGYVEIVGTKLTLSKEETGNSWSEPTFAVVSDGREIRFVKTTALPPLSTGLFKMIKVSDGYRLQALTNTSLTVDNLPCRPGKNITLEAGKTYKLKAGEFEIILTTDEKSEPPKPSGTPGGGMNRGGLGFGGVVAMTGTLLLGALGMASAHEVGEVVHQNAPNIVGLLMAFGIVGGSVLGRLRSSPVHKEKAPETVSFEKVLTNSGKSVVKLRETITDVESWQNVVTSLKTQDLKPDDLVSLVIDRNNGHYIYTVDTYANVSATDYTNVIQRRKRSTAEIEFVTSTDSSGRTVVYEDYVHVESSSQNGGQGRVLFDTWVEHVKQNYPNAKITSQVVNLKVFTLNTGKVGNLRAMEIPDPSLHPESDYQVDPLKTFSPKFIETCASVGVINREAAAWLTANSSIPSWQRHNDFVKALKEGYSSAKKEGSTTAENEIEYLVEKIKQHKDQFQETKGWGSLWIEGDVAKNFNLRRVEEALLIEKHTTRSEKHSGIESTRIKRGGVGLGGMIATIGSIILGGYAVAHAASELKDIAGVAANHLGMLGAMGVAGLKVAIDSISPTPRRTLQGQDNDASHALTLLRPQDLLLEIKKLYNEHPTALNNLTTKSPDREFSDYLDEISQKLPQDLSLTSLDSLPHEQARALSVVLAQLPHEVLKSRLGEDILNFVLFNCPSSKGFDDLLSSIEWMTTREKELVKIVREKNPLGNPKISTLIRVKTYELFLRLEHGDLIESSNLHDILRRAAQKDIPLDRLKRYSLQVLSTEDLVQGGEDREWSSPLHPDRNKERWQIYLDTTFAIALMYDGKPNAIVGFEPSFDVENLKLNLKIIQLQGARPILFDKAGKRIGPGNSWGLNPIDWKKVLVDITSAFIQNTGFDNVVIQSGHNNKWINNQNTPDFYLPLEKALTIYDDLARRLNFIQGPDRNWYNLIPVPKYSENLQVDKREGKKAISNPI